MPNSTLPSSKEIKEIRDQTLAAARSGNLAKLKKLLQCLIDIVEGNLPLSDNHKEIIAYLLKDVNIDVSTLLSRKDLSPQAKAAIAATQGNVELLRSSLAGISTNIVGDIFYNCFSLAVRSNKVEAVRFLLSVGGPSQEDLSYAAQAGYAEIVEALAKAGANIYQLDPETIHPNASQIIKEIKAAHTDIVNYCEEREGAKTLEQIKSNPYFDPLVVPLCKEGDTAILVAIKAKKIEIAEGLIEAYPELLMDVAEKFLKEDVLLNNLPIMKWLDKAGTTITRHLEGNQEPLPDDITKHHCYRIFINVYLCGSLTEVIKEGLAEKKEEKKGAIEKLLKLGADPNFSTGTFSQTPFLISIEGANAELVEFLLEHNANPNATLLGLPILKVVELQIESMKDQELSEEEEERLDNLKKIKALLQKKLSKNNGVAYGAGIGAALGLASGIGAWFLFDLTVIAGISLVNPYIPALIIVAAAAMVIGAGVGALVGWVADLAQPQPEAGKTHTL